MSGRLRMTVKAGRREFILKYADRELGVLMGNHGAEDWFPEGLGFVKATGVYDNFSVANGQSTEAWVTKTRASVLAAAQRVLRAAERESQMLRRRKAAWLPKMTSLVRFLRASRARRLSIRHHYGWN